MTDLTKKLIGDPTQALPPEIADLVQALLEGRVVQMAMAIQTDDAVFTFHKAYDNHDWFKLVGMVEALKDDIMQEVRKPAEDEDPDN